MNTEKLKRCPYVCSPAFCNCDEGKCEIKRDLAIRRIRLPIIHAINEERDRQDAKWGEQNHDPGTWLNILMEEVGEASKAYLEFRFGTAALVDYRMEMVQVAAVALAMIECYDRQMESVMNQPALNLNSDESRQSPDAGTETGAETGR